MSRLELERELAAATGESVRTLRRRGFSLVDPQETNFDPEPNDLPAQVLDWDSYAPVPLRRVA